ncbi:hypothetical protein ACXZ1K_00730 [Pedobacter sp. PWIIR3]
MPGQLTTNAEALRLFFTDDLYLVPNEVTETPLQNEQIPIPQALKKSIDFKFLGKNGRNILLVVNDAENDVSNENGRELLRKIVKSINLTAADFALVNYARHQSATFEDMTSFFSSKLAFVFGVSPTQLGLAQHPSNVVVTEGNVRVIFSDELQKLDQDLSTKKALWTVLQKLEISC